MKRWSYFLLAPACLLATCLVLMQDPDAHAAQAKDDAAKPKLVVLVVFDQLRGDYFAKWQDLFEEDGFKRLLEEGAWFDNCHYPYSDTLTAAGHTSLVTGCSPNKHGIIANEWYDRVSGDTITSVGSERYEILFTPEPPRKKDDKDKAAAKDDKKDSPAPAKKLAGASPLRRREESIGDVLYRLTQGKAKIVSLSIKDRAALLMAALRAQFVYWFSSQHGGFVTSNYYNEETLHSWVHDFNKKKPADGWFGKDWSLLKAGFDYAKRSGPDDVKAEGTGFEQGRTFPHDMKGGLDKPGASFYEAVANSPYGNELLLAMAKTAIDAENLGRNESTDMLCLSFSSNDLVGHCWGPDSQEVLDITLRSDLIMKDLLATLDAKVGKGKYLVVLSADHGVCPIPEVAKAQGKDAGRVSPDMLKGGAAAFFQEKFAKGKDKLPWIEAAEGSWVYFNKGVLRSQGLAAADVETALAGWLVQQPGVQAAFTRSQLMKKDKVADPLVDSVRLSFHPEASGDVKVLFKPNYLFTTSGKRAAAYATTHGSPHPYDTHVPLLVYGPGVVKGKRNDRVTPQAATPIIAHSLRLPTPTGSEVPLPKGLFAE